MARASRGPTITGVKGKGLKAQIARLGVAAYLAEVDERAEDFTPAWPGVIAEFHAEEEELFAKEGAIGGHPRWKALRPSYKKWKDSVAPGVPILYLGARGPHQSLANALTDPTTGGCRCQWGKSHLLIQTDVPVDGYDLGGIHTTGRGAPNPMPAREPIRLSMAEVWRMVGINDGPILNWLLEGKSSTRAAYA